MLTEMAQHILEYPAAYKSRGKYGDHHFPAVFSIVKRHYQRRQVIAQTLRAQLPHADAQRVFETLVPALEPAVIEQIEAALSVYETTTGVDLARIYERARAQADAALFHGFVEFGGKKVLAVFGHKATRANADAFRRAGVLKGKRGRPAEILSRRSLRGIK
ncbi:MAG: hypothetical protein NTV22_15265 [bacterium]|nr:hypothetical protein [bacterium]